MRELRGAVRDGCGQNYRVPPNYAEARPFHNALIAANPHNLVWGTD